MNKLKPHRPVGNYVDKKLFKSDRLWKLIDGEFYTEVNGQLLTEKQFDKQFKITNPVNLYWNTENPDSTKRYLL